MKALGQNLGGEIDKTNERLERTSERLDAVRIELKQEIASLGQRLERAEGRLESTEKRFTGVEKALLELTAHTWMSRFVETTIDHHEQDISQLKERCARMEVQQEGH
jgi:chromosome segregation ATPase